MNRSWSIMLPMAALVLSSCGSDSAPSGQVAATVDGEEITVTEVNSELGGAEADNPDQQQELANRALDAIVSRTIVANQAIERGLDQTPEGAMALEKARQLALVELLQSDLRSEVPRPSDTEAEQFVTENPALFRNRKISVVEQLAVPQITTELVRQMEPIDTLSGIRELLDSNGVEYRSSVGTVDMLTLNPEMAQQISGMGVGEVYVLPQGRGVRVNAIRSSEPYPVADDEAVELAREMLMRQRVSSQLSQTLQQMVEQGRENVDYADAFSRPQNAAPTPEASGDAAAPEQPAIP